MDIKLEKKKHKDGSFSLNVGCAEYHYANCSKDEKLIDGIRSAVEIIILGLKSQEINNGQNKKS